jgi:hypothetical protein
VLEGLETVDRFNGVNSGDTREDAEGMFRMEEQIRDAGKRMIRTIIKSKGLSPLVLFV